MDIDTFIARYGPEWRRLDAACARGARGLRGGHEIDDAVDLYQRACTHLAEVQTIYRDRTLEDYLGTVVSKAHAAIYSAESPSLGGLATAAGDRYRRAVRSTAPYIAVAASLLVAVSMATMLWVATSREARAGVLPSFARESVEESGGRIDPATERGRLSTFILLNNVQVSFLAFAFGITAGVGTIFVLVQNAALLGALAGAYQSLGQSWSFWALILPHGLLELTAICIAAGAGLRMGWSFIDPGDRPRGTALAEESREAVVAVMGAIPAFVVAAAVEGFVTGVAPRWLGVALGVALFLGYLAFLFVRPPARRPAGRRVLPA